MITPSFKSAALALLIPLFVYPAKAAQSENPAQQKSPQAQQNIQQPAATISVNNENVKKPEGPTQEAEGRSEQTKPVSRAEKIQIVISGLLTLIVLDQLVIYWQQRNIMDKTADYTKIGERAYMGIRAVTLEKFGLGKEPVLGLKFVNGGRTPAWNVSVGISFGMGTRFPTERPRIKSESNLLPAGIDQEVQIQIPVVITAVIIKELMDETTKMFIRGEVQFRDAWNDKRKFYFNLVYIPSENKFGNYKEEQPTNEPSPKASGSKTDR
jgi:hypothetical protein